MGDAVQDYVEKMEKDAVSDFLDQYMQQRIKSFVRNPEVRSAEDIDALLEEPLAEVLDENVDDEDMKEINAEVSMSFKGNSERKSRDSDPSYSDSSLEASEPTETPKPRTSRGRRESSSVGSKRKIQRSRAQGRQRLKRSRKKN